MHVSHAQAIHSALAENWDEAVRLNLEILVKSPDSVDTLNRLGFAYLRCGNIKKAKATYERVLKLDRYNAIALKNLQKVKVQGSGKVHQSKRYTLSSSDRAISPSLFLEEPGRTKIISLVNVAPSRILFTLSIGENIELVSKRHTLEVRGKKGLYLGAMPDDLGFRLRRLIVSGNRYQAYVKSVAKNSLAILVKEVKRSKKFRNQPTFPTNGDTPIYSFIRVEQLDDPISEDQRSSSGDDSDE